MKIKASESKHLRYLSSKVKGKSRINGISIQKNEITEGLRINQLRFLHLPGIWPGEPDNLLENEWPCHQADKSNAKCDDAQGDNRVAPRKGDQLDPDTSHKQSSATHQ